MKEYIFKSNKPKSVQKLMNEALDILAKVGIPLETKSNRGLERMAVCFLAVAGVKKEWKEAKDVDDKVSLKTRDIIQIVNKHFNENISSGSYDNIRRKDLKLLIVADLIISTGSKRGAATNDPTRGYALHPDFKNLISQYNTGKWSKELLKFKKGRPSLAEILERKRNIAKVAVTLPNGKPLQLSLGEHNVLQKALIEEFLTRYGSDCEVLYVGDTSNKILHIEENELQRLKFFELSHKELPDIIAYSKKKNWLYLIEAVHSSGPMSELRVLELKRMLKDCKAELIFVTGFLTRDIFRKWVQDIAWETEVWIADNPDHLIHFNGHKFLGAY